MSILIKALKQAERDHMARTGSTQAAPSTPARAPHPLSLEPVELQTRDETSAPPPAAQSPTAASDDFAGDAIDLAIEDSPGADEAPEVVPPAVETAEAIELPAASAPAPVQAPSVPQAETHSAPPRRLATGPSPVEAAAPDASPAPRPVTSPRSRPPTPGARNGAETMDERDAARKLFAPAPHSNPSRRGRYLAMAGIIGVVVCGFLAWQGMIPGLPDLKGVFASLPEEAPRVSLAERLGQQADKAVKSAVPAPTAKPAAAVSAGEASGVSGQAPRLVAAHNPAALAHPENTPSAPANVDPARPASASGAIHVHSDSPPERVRGLLLQAYAAAGLGDSRTAQSLYQQVIDQDPNNGDAWNGLAALTANSGDRAGAARLYQRALEIDPGDSIAMGGLLGLQTGADPQEVETRLRVLIARDAAQPALQAALGRLLARQSRWLEAQEAYFHAWAADSTQPDVAFNLAVTLEHIRQSPAALGFYRRALELARNHGAHFDQNVARERIAALETSAH